MTPFVLIALSQLASPCPAPARNVVIVTLDGVRPLEFFDGAQRELMRGVEDEAGLAAKFDRLTRDRRREALMPFVWQLVARRGQVFGNAELGSPLTLSNPRRCSYPGYAELFTGFADERITGNDFGPNPNVTVLEWLERQRGLEGQVQVFATWETFLRIFNVERSKLDVRAGWNPPFEREVERTPARDALDSVFRGTTPLFGGNALDAMTFAALKESLRTRRPRVLVLGLGEPDEWMHHGRYDLALESIHRADALLAELWALLQSLPEYRGTTTLLLTTDHGRGLGARDWQEHGESIAGSEQTWFAAVGPGVSPLGERAATGPLSSTSFASTIAALLGFDWQRGESRAEAPFPLDRIPRVLVRVRDGVAER